MLNNSGELSENSDLEPDYPTLENYIKEYFTMYGTTLKRYCGHLYETEIDTVKIPYGVTTIGESAFKNCKNIKNIIIPNSVTSIGEDAFYYCANLKSITIGNGVTSIGKDAFIGCHAITSVYITDLKAWCNIDCTSGLWWCKPNFYLNKKLLTEVTADMLQGVTKIKHMVFYCCQSLISITIPDSVTSIDYGAFSGCSNLKKVIIPNSVTSIGSEAFAGCGCETLPSSPYIGALKIYCYAKSKPMLWYVGWNFVSENDDHTKYAKVYWGFKEEFGFEIWDSRLLCYKGTEKEVKIPEGITSIGVRAFANCTGLKSITIPASVISIDRGAFINCTGVTIYCNATKKPKGWDKNWNIYKGNNIFTQKRLHVVWGNKS